MELFNFLCEHVEQRHPPAKWAELCGIVILDADGWRKHRFDNFADPITLPDFIQRAKISTIAPRQ